MNQPPPVHNFLHREQDVGEAPPDYDAVFTQGRRVYVRRNGAADARSNQVGTIISPVPGRARHYVVHLDEPVFVHRMDGRTDAVSWVIEAGEHLAVLLSEPPHRTNRQE